MDKTEQEKIEARLKLLLNLTRDNGCMPGEVETAAYKIGSLVQKYKLDVTFPHAHTEKQESQKSESTYAKNGAFFAYGVVHIRGVSEKAILCHDLISDVEFWVPRSQCRNGCEHWEKGKHGMLYTSRWWAEKEGWT
mgnify:CR=1 FL=1